MLSLTRMERREAHIDNLSTPGWKRVGGLSTAMTLCGAIPGLARNNGRHAPAIIHAWTQEGVGACRLPPHHEEPFPNSLVKVGGAHRQAITPDEGRLLAASTLRGADPRLTRDSGRRAPAARDDCYHTVRSRSRTHPQWWEARTGPMHTDTQPRCRQARSQTMCTVLLLGLAKQE